MNTNVTTRIYRNDSDQTFIIPGIGEVLPDQRVSISSEFPTPINLLNYPGLVDVLEEEANGEGRDYHKTPETPYESPAAGGDLQTNTSEGNQQ